MPPLIGLTTSLATRPPVRAQLNVAYIEAVQLAGGVPVLLTPGLSAAALEALLATVQGVVLTGGGDVDPARYGEERHPSVAGVLDERDTLEAAVIEHVFAQDVPLLAICRGMQMLNVAQGGSLCQDIPSQLTGALQHAAREEGEEPMHAVRVEGGSRLAALVGGDALHVNSRHHQAVARPGEGLRPVAWAADGVVEGMDVGGLRFGVAVQWHPEDLSMAGDEPSRRLFAAVVEAAAGR